MAKGGSSKKKKDAELQPGQRTLTSFFAVAAPRASSSTAASEAAPKSKAASAKAKSKPAKSSDNKENTSKKKKKRTRDEKDAEEDLVEEQELVDLMDTEDEDDDDLNKKPAAAASVRRSPRRHKQNQAAKKKRKKEEEDDDDDDDDDDYMMMDMEEDEEEEGEEEEYEEEKPKAKATTKKKNTTTRKKRGASSSKKSAAAEESDDDDDNDKKTELQKQYDTKFAKDWKAYNPNNNPQKLPKQGTYVEPVGIDPTHGIVEGIIETQVRKIGGLLQLVKAHHEEEEDDDDVLKGELTFPIKLQTACSGTDAPSIALGLVKESLDKLLSAGNSGFFEYSHEMSCEIVPFKQAYISRNFPGVLLFPDIVKLTESEQVLDVYGRPQHIPYGNLFVAGTSCKDFSMLKTTYRLDIEDKGTSGETFLAAVEMLEEKQPPVAIFENTDGAPWMKMQEYIRGRIHLSERNNAKSIKGTKKPNADKDLTFSVNEHGQYVAEEVPRQVGIRAGSIVEGFVKHGHEANDIVPLVSDSKDVSAKLITLGQLAKKHKINLKADTLVMVKKARYCTHLCKVDTKDYGLPQTRNRKYLFIWRSDDPIDDLGDYFQEILDHLKTPLLHSMDAFLLPDTHDRIRCFREALRSGPGIMVQRARAKELDFWDWELSSVKDLTLHKVFREKSGIADRSRWLTGWDTRGRKSIAPGLWPELFDCWNMRRLDMVDCFSAAAIRDSISRDPLHHSFTWDLSQNVTRAPFRTATVGVSSCVTPGGEILLPHKGRTVMGYEKLLLQGIPFSRLRLGPESEVELSDLAGNAMSVSVVSATMLAAMCAPQLRRQRMKDARAPLANFALNQKYDKAGGGVLAERGDLYNAKRDTSAKQFEEVIGNVAKELAHEAWLSSVLCTCESSGTTTKSSEILECSGCGKCVCHDCSGRYQVASHDLREIDVNGNTGRPDPHKFETKLRCAVPSILRLGQGWESSLENGEGLESYSFQLQQVERKKGHWKLIYGAWEDHGCARQVADIRVIIGRTGTLDSDIGAAAYIRCFAPAIRHKKPLRGTLFDSARLIVKVSELNKAAPRWEVPTASTKCSLEIAGSDPCDSQRVQVGLNKEAYKSIQAHTVRRDFIPPIKSRNNLITYDPLWKTWPGTLVVSGDTSGRVNGTYRKLDCQHTVNLSALWCRDGTKDQPPLYIYLRPDVIRAGLDVAVISATPLYADNMEICELIDWIPENSLKNSTHKTDASFLEWEQGPASLKVEVPTPTMNIVTQTESFHQRVSDASKKDSPDAVLCEMSGLSKEVIMSLLEQNGTNDGIDVSTIDLFGKSGTRNAKRLSVIAAPSLLKCAAEEKLPLHLSKWYKLSASSEFGRCTINVPTRPIGSWVEVKGRKGTRAERVYDAEESNEYYQKLLSRPTAFQVSVVKSQGKLVVRANPYVAAHRAAAQLGGEDTGSIEVDYCLSELSSMGEPDTKEFHVPNSDAYAEKRVDGLELPLYKRQAKALTRMLEIENGDVPFSEEERSEHVLPGIGWCLMARAAKKSPLRGGVLGDAIGSGKTVVTIALILAGASKARSSRNIEEGRSGATLIVVPPGLVRQWDDERKKFTKGQLKSLVIQCTADLKRYSVEEICSADMVVVPADIIEEDISKRRPYTEQLSKKAGAGKIPPAPKSHSQREAPTIEGTWVRNMASGPEIYVGNNGNQRKRDEQAYYGHCYSEAVAKLRERTFKESERGVPLEWFTWERVVVDECHETLVTGKQFVSNDDSFKQNARRGAREFLGVSQTEIEKRPLIAARGVWGLTGTPLLETEARVTELANLMGGTYLTGAAHHWRKEERESGRDLFLNQQEATHSREYRCAVQAACHDYVKEACQRNRGEELQVKLTREQRCVNMSSTEGETFLGATSDIQSGSFAISADQLGEKTGDVLSILSSSKARHSALIETIDSIHQAEPDTKIIVFANSSYGGYKSALAALTENKEFCHVSDSDTVQRQNEVISWFRHVDVTNEEKARPRILLLSFEQAAGHNLQEACHNVIIYDPMYSGTDAVADASVEEQAVGRVMRQGQKYDVTVTRIVLKGPNGERCVDDWIVERNLDEDVLKAATSNFD